METSRLKSWLSQSRVYQFDNIGITESQDLTYMHSYVQLTNISEKAFNKRLDHLDIKFSSTYPFSFMAVYFIENKL